MNIQEQWDVCGASEYGRIFENLSLHNNYSYMWNKCLDINNPSNGTRAQVWTCNNSNPQLFSHYADGSLKVFGKCLNAHAWGREVSVWDCGGGDNEKWIIEGNGKIRNKYNGLCLDMDWGATGSPQNGTPVHLHECDANSTWQDWTDNTNYLGEYPW